MLILSKVLIREIREIRGYYYFVSSCFRGKCFKRKFLCIQVIKPRIYRILRIRVIRVNSWLEKGNSYAIKLATNTHE